MPKVLSLFAGLALALLVLTGCGDDDPSSAGGTGTVSAAAGAAFPATITHRYGSTEIERAPERIVTVGLVEQDALLALGITPVATTEWFGERPGAIFPWAKDEQGDAPDPTVLKSPTGAVQFEKIAALRPDLILALYADLKQADYDKLSRIAPVVVAPKQYVPYGIPWQEVTTIVGRAVGRAERAAELVDGVERQLADAKAAHPEFADRRGLVATYYEGKPYVYGPQDPRGRLLASLGFSLPDGLQEYVGSEFGRDLSEERADLLDVDAITWIVGSERDRQVIRDRPTYRRLAVRQKGREVFVDEGTTLGQAVSFISVLSIPYLLDELVPQLSTAVERE